MREDIRHLKSICLGSNAHIVNTIVEEATQSSRMSNNLIDGGSGSFNHLQSYEGNSTNKETYNHLPDAIMSTDVKYDYPCSANTLPTAADPKLGDWEQTSVAAKHVVSGSPFIGDQNGNKVMGTPDRDTVKHINFPEASSYPPRYNA